MQTHTVEGGGALRLHVHEWGKPNAQLKRIIYSLCRARALWRTYAAATRRCSTLSGSLARGRRSRPWSPLAWAARQIAAAGSGFRARVCPLRPKTCTCANKARRILIFPMRNGTCARLFRAG